ncbi:hypothetical protein Pla123a_23100 [Posidoniimonas polymericola]|uniref:MetA-pathway of phenol degradation n=1 Tax=Posidoniimonas polymericola TaxID=2528002 RepID=A0A5C5YPQ1_9BACT|nr:hypothetical protein [Posidoniimonas polymericola]TWT76886.1 hypothetical protein Pla123a_23100 [Posidoniimonas polymericola]
MQRRSHHGSIQRLTLAAVLLTANAARGQEAAVTPLPDLSSPPMVDPQVQPAGYGSSGGGSPACTACYDPWSAGVEFGITRFVHTNGNFALIDDEVGASFRPYLGYETPEGVGVRGSVFIAAAESVAIDADDSSLFEANPVALSIDIELYRRLRFDSFELLLGAGAQGAGYGFEFPDGGDTTWAGGGGSLMAEGRQLIHVSPCSEWSVIGGGQVGYLLGEKSYSSPPGYDDVGLTMTTGRAYLGFEYRRHLSRGDLLFQLKGETQVWRADGMPGMGLDTTGFQFGAAW